MRCECRLTLSPSSDRGQATCYHGLIGGLIMTAHSDVALVMARLMAGVVGNARRSVHLFAAASQYPGNLTALCGDVFYSADLEFLEAFKGMPCERCLINAPSPRARS